MTFIDATQWCKNKDSNEVCCSYIIYLGRFMIYVKAVVQTEANLLSVFIFNIHPNCTDNSKPWNEKTTRD